MNIFEAEAPKYWAVGLPVIPLRYHDKMPSINGWQLFADKFPEEEEQQAWMYNYPEGNLGLVLGPVSGLIAIDIDAIDPVVVDAIEKILPPSPWLRVGAKGSMRVYKYNGQRTTRIKGPNGEMLVEILSKGTQFVLPPSIHPATKKPYTANGHLYELLDRIVPLPMHFEELLRSALASVGVEVQVGEKAKVATFVPAGARDNAMVTMAGIQSRGVCRGERTLLEALAEMKFWVENFTENVIGDPLSVDKAQGKLIEFLIRDVTGERKHALPPGWDDGLTDDDKVKMGLSFTADDELWDGKRILTYLAAEFERFEDPSNSGWTSAVDVALAKLASGQGSMSLLDEERVQRFIVAQSKGTLSTSVLKKQVNMLRKGDITGENHQEIAIKVDEYISQYGELRWDAGNFWQWNGANWEMKSDKEIQLIIQREFGFYPACKRLSDYVGVLKALAVNLHGSKGGLQDGNHRGLNFANGFLNENLELVPHDPEWGMTYTLPYRYMPELAGHMPKFNEYLVDSWGEDPDFGDKVLALQEAMGVTLFGAACRQQRAFCLIGQAGSGKSRILSILRGLVPPQTASSIPPSDWGDKYLPAGLFGKIINFAGELSESRQIPGEKFKEIVEGTTITSQHKNMPPFEFAPIAAHWFGSNHNPKTRDTSEGFVRRWLFLEWNHKVPAHKINRNLDQEILQFEREAIVAWAVEGYQRLQQNGDFTLPMSHLARADQMAQDNNTVRYFLQSNPKVRVGSHRTEGSISELELFGEYWNFCISTNTAPRVGQKVFHNMMKELQEILGFKQRVRATDQGHTECFYEFISLDGKR